MPVQFRSPKLIKLGTLSEHDEQVLFLAMFEERWPDIRILAIPNGGARPGKTAVNLKTEGVRPGVPDLFVPARNLWIEMKRATGGKLSPEQKDWIEYLNAIGHRAIVGHGAEDAIRKIQAFM